MRQVRSTNTKPELLIRSALHQEGYRFRLHLKTLPGKPDIVLPRYKTAIFVNGCFWHGHTCVDGEKPQTNQEYWQQKIQRNKARDAQHLRNLRRKGWKCIVVWACELRNADRVIARITKQLETRFPGAAPRRGEQCHA